MRLFAALVCIVILRAVSATASVIYNNGAGVTSQPPGDQGWSVTGEWDTAGGVAIAPSYFLTVQHVGANIGVDQFYLNGVAYTSTASQDISGTDLRVVKVSGTFPAYAQLYSGGAGNELGQTVSIVGVGHFQLGAQLITNSVQNGWYWGSALAMNYASNTVSAVSSFGTTSNYLDIKFNAPGVGIYTYGDSGGGNFILNNGAYQLAGLTEGIQDYYVKNGDGSYTDLDNPSANTGVAVFNATGLYENTADAGQTPVYAPATGAEDGYATEIAPYISQIDAITGVPEPTLGALAGIVSIVGLLARRSRKDLARGIV
ncbi:MAG TPA: trypsin-like serine protease [Tepidisphaeraceae bacterium]|jgi:hypothetical protein|nr:trypsin-like serine protease [Tepidisphaeraceae bacterium]